MVFVRDAWLSGPMLKLVVLLQRRADNENVAAVGSRTSEVAWWNRSGINTDEEEEADKAKRRKEVSHNRHNS